MNNKHSINLRELEDLILEYKKEIEPRKKHILYIRLVQSSMKMVNNSVLFYSVLSPHVSKEDLIQVGALGLLSAIEYYTPRGKGSFKTYATKVIRGKIAHYLRDKVNLVRPPREAYSNLSKIRDAISKLSSEDTTIPSATEIAHISGLSKEKVEEVMNIDLIKNMISLDQNIYSYECCETLMDRLPDDDKESFEEIYEKKRIIEEALGKLPDIERQVIKMYYFEELSRKTISEKLNISPTQTSRVLKRAIYKLSLIMKRDLEG